jgi:hypothetical protein
VVDVLANEEIIDSTAWYWPMKISITESSKLSDKLVLRSILFLNLAED